MANRVDMPLAMTFRSFSPLKLTLVEDDPLLGIGTLWAGEVTLHAKLLYGPEQVLPLLS